MYRFFIVLLITSACKHQDYAYDKQVSSKEEIHDSLWKVKNDFLSDPIFKDSHYQHEKFKNYQGLWSLVRTEFIKENRTRHSKFEDVLFENGKCWTLDYPCTWHKYYEEVYFRNDSIFLTTSDRVYIQKSKIELIGDTLRIYDDYESEYYVKKHFESAELGELKLKGFNEKCITDKWTLMSITYDGFEEIAINDSAFVHVPRFIDLNKGIFMLENGYLINSTDESIKFKVTQFNRTYTEYSGESYYLILSELKKIQGRIYEFHYERILD